MPKTAARLSLACSASKPPCPLVGKNLEIPCLLCKQASKPCLQSKQSNLVKNRQPVGALLTLLCWGKQANLAYSRKLLEPCLPTTPQQSKQSFPFLGKNLTIPSVLDTTLFDRSYSYLLILIKG